MAYVALFVALGGVSYAVIPSGDGTINGCYSNSKGALRVIDAGAGATCAAGETAISWKTGTNPAGGDLSGSYPNPEIGAGKVGSAEIADLTVGNSDLAPASVGRNKIAASAVTSAKVADNTLTGGDVLDSSLRLGDMTWLDYGTNTNIMDNTLLAAHTCQDAASNAGAQAGDVALPIAIAGKVPPGIVLMPLQTFDDAPRIRICNISNSDIDLTYPTKQGFILRFLVLR